MVDAIEIDLSGDRSRRELRAHRWWSRRSAGYSTVVTLLAHSPERASSADDLAAIASNPATATERVLEGTSLLDLCAGACLVASAASRLGAQTTAVDLHPIPVLIGRAELVLPVQYGSADGASTGASPDGTWLGLANELEHWAVILLDQGRSSAGDLWLHGVDGVRCSVRLACPGCGRSSVANPEPARSRWSSCPNCGQRFSGSTAHVAGFDLGAPLSSEDSAKLSEVATMLASTPYPSSLGPTLDRPWVLGASGWVALRDAVSPRQACVVRALQTALRSVRDDMADRGYRPEHAAAVLTYLALGLSSAVDLLSRFTTWDERRHAVRGLDRSVWHRRSEYVEIGGKELTSRLRRRFDELGSIILANQDRSESIHVRSGDMTDLKEPDSSFDLVIWDPPFYDNIDYDNLSLPWTRFLRSTIGDLDQTLQWPTDPSEGATGRVAFDIAGYLDSLRLAGEEIARVLKSGGRLGVHWVARTGREVDDLAGFLEKVEPAGLELVQSFAFSPATSHRLTPMAGGPQPLLLVLRKVHVVQPSDASSVVAAQHAGQKMMVAGLVELLEAHLDEEDLEDLIPSDFRGARSEKLAEAALSVPNPQRFLERVPKKALREYALARGADPAEVAALDHDGIANVVFHLLGWRAPVEPSFTVGGALDTIDQRIGQLRLVPADSNVAGIVLNIAAAVEDILRFSVICWLSAIHGELWESTLVEFTGQPGHMTMGIWLKAFNEVPLRLAAESSVIGHAQRMIRKSGVRPHLDTLIRLRNRAAHPAPDEDWGDVRGKTITEGTSVVKAFRAADSGGALPTMLRPIEESRDSYGRITLKLVGHGGHRVEFLMTQASDLSRPIVLIPGDTNPREVDPICMDAELIENRTRSTSQR